MVYHATVVHADHCRRTCPCREHAEDAGAAPHVEHCLAREQRRVAQDGVAVGLRAHAVLQHLLVDGQRRVAVKVVAIVGLTSRRCLTPSHTAHILLSGGSHARRLRSRRGLGLAHRQSPHQALRLCQLRLQPCDGGARGGQGGSLGPAAGSRTCTHTSASAPRGGCGGCVSARGSGGFRGDLWHSGVGANCSTLVAVDLVIRVAVTHGFLQDAIAIDTRAQVLLIPDPRRGIVGCGHDRGNLVAGERVMPGSGASCERRLCFHAHQVDKAHEPKVVQLCARGRGVCEYMMESTAHTAGGRSTHGASAGTVTNRSQLLLREPVPLRRWPLCLCARTAASPAGGTRRPPPSRPMCHPLRRFLLNRSWWATVGAENVNSAPCVRGCATLHVHAIITKLGTNDAARLKCWLPASTIIT